MRHNITPRRILYRIGSGKVHIHYYRWAKLVLPSAGRHPMRRRRHRTARVYWLRHDSRWRRRPRGGSFVIIISNLPPPPPTHFSQYTPHAPHVHTSCIALGSPPLKALLSSSLRTVTSAKLLLLFGEKNREKMTKKKKKMQNVAHHSHSLCSFFSLSSPRRMKRKIKFKKKTLTLYIFVCVRARFFRVPTYLYLLSYNLTYNLTLT